MPHSDDADDPREHARRSSDEVRYWLPLLLSLLTTMLALGIVYGQLGGRLDLIEYRLHQIEQKVQGPR